MIPQTPSLCYAMQSHPISSIHTHTNHHETPIGALAGVPGFLFIISLIIQSHSSPQSPFSSSNIPLSKLLTLLRRPFLLRVPLPSGLPQRNTIESIALMLIKRLHLREHALELLLAGAAARIPSCEGGAAEALPQDFVAGAGVEGVVGLVEEGCAELGGCVSWGGEEVVGWECGGREM